MPRVSVRMILKKQVHSPGDTVLFSTATEVNAQADLNVYW